MSYFIFFASPEDSVLQQEVMSLMQVVQDVNAMAEDLSRHTEFAILLMSPEARGLESGRTEVWIENSLILGEPKIS